MKYAHLHYFTATRQLKPSNCTHLHYFAVKRPFGEININLKGDYELTKSGKKFPLPATDQLSGFIILTDKIADSVVSAFLRLIVPICGSHR